MFYTVNPPSDTLPQEVEVVRLGMLTYQVQANGYPLYTAGGELVHSWLAQRSYQCVRSLNSVCGTYRRPYERA